MDKNEPFYIGIGSKKRANQKGKRNDIWKKIAAKTDYEVELLFESEDKNWIKQKEVEFINLYGRIDLGTGILANMTKGGDGGGLAGSTIEKMMNTCKERGVDKQRDARLKEMGKTRSGSNNLSAKPIYIYNTEGKFIKDYTTHKQCREELDISITHFYRCINTYISAKGYFLSKTYTGEFLENISSYTTKGIRIKYVQKIDPESNKCVSTYRTVNDAALSIQLPRNTLYKYINSGRQFNGYLWNHSN